MATKKKTSSKKLSQKVQKMIQTDVFKSIAIASVLLNVLFLITIVVLTATSTFDRELYLSARERYCKNTASIKARSEELGSKTAAKQEWQIDCVGKDFYPFYKEATDRYQADLNQEK